MGSQEWVAYSSTATVAELGRGVLYPLRNTVNRSTANT